MCPRFFVCCAGACFKNLRALQILLICGLYLEKGHIYWVFGEGAHFFPKPCYFVWYIGNNVYICLDLDFWKFFQGFEKNVPPEWNSGKYELSRPAHNIVRVSSLDTLYFLIPVQTRLHLVFEGCFGHVLKTGRVHNNLYNPGFFVKKGCIMGFYYFGHIFLKTLFFCSNRVRDRF